MHIYYFGGCSPCFVDDDDSSFVVSIGCNAKSSDSSSLIFVNPFLYLNDL